MKLLFRFFKSPQPSRFNFARNNPHFFPSKRRPSATLLELARLGRRPMNLKLAASERWASPPPAAAHGVFPARGVSPLSLEYPTRSLHFVRRVTPSSTAAAMMKDASAIALPVFDMEEGKKLAGVSLADRYIPVQGRQALSLLRDNRAVKVSRPSRGLHQRSLTDDVYAIAGRLQPDGLVPVLHGGHVHQQGPDQGAPRVGRDAHALPPLCQRPLRLYVPPSLPTLAHRPKPALTMSVTP
jgi:hypothetical protein